MVVVRPAGLRQQGSRAIEVRAIGQRSRSGDLILRDVSLAVDHGELIAIIGTSGPANTTLLDAMSGLRPPWSGSVLRAPGRVGYVPRGDAIHASLPLARTLRYTASLREVAAGDAAVDDVLRVLDLSGRAVRPAGDLSRGERKQASIAAELLVRPGLFFLDEPTSGLDPARAAELMRVLRRLCDNGATVVLTTHNPLDADRCDKIAVLANGGHLAFFGTPAAARDYFGADSLDEIYERLAGLGDPAKAWSRRFFPFSRTHNGVSPAPVVPRQPGPDVRLPDSAGPLPAAGAPAPAPAPVLRTLWQWSVLTRRNADILSRTRRTLAILGGAPAAVLLVFLVLFRPGAFDAAHPSPEASVLIVFWVAFGAFFTGLAYGLPQICAELGVLRRERFAGLGAGAYVLAKAAVLVPLLAVADAALLVVLRALGRLPAAGDYPAAFVTLLLSSAAALGLGLLISAAVSRPSQATIAMPLACVPLVLLAGAILPVPAMAPVGRWVSYATADRWAFEALGHSLGVRQLLAGGRSPLGVPLLASYGTTFDRAVAVDWLVLACFTAAFFAATIALVIRKTSRPPHPAR